MLSLLLLIFLGTVFFLIFKFTVAFIAIMVIIAGYNNNYYTRVCLAGNIVSPESIGL